MPSISHIALDDANLPPPTPEIEQERKVAMFDLLEQNTFVLPTRDGREMPAGPYHVGLSIREPSVTTSADQTTCCQRRGLRASPLASQSWTL